MGNAGGSSIAPSFVWFRRICSSMVLTMRHKLNKSLRALWQIIARDDNGNVTAPAQRQCNERVSVDAAISSTGETGVLAEIGICAVSLKMAVSPRAEND